MTKITKKQSVETAIVFAIVAVFLGLQSNHRYWFFTAVVILILALILPTIYKPLAYIWFGLSKILGWIMSRLILSFVFYLLVVPVAFLRRVSGKDPLLLKSFKKDRSSAFVKRVHEFTSNDLTYPF